MSARLRFAVAHKIIMIRTMRKRVNDESGVPERSRSSGSTGSRGLKINMEMMKRPEEYG